MSRLSERIKGDFEAMREMCNEILQVVQQQQQHQHQQQEQQFADNLPLPPIYMLNEYCLVELLRYLSIVDTLKFATVFPTRHHLPAVDGCPSEVDATLNANVRVQAAVNTRLHCGGTARFDWATICQIASSQIADFFHHYASKITKLELVGMCAPELQFVLHHFGHLKSLVLNDAYMLGGQWACTPMTGQRQTLPLSAVPNNNKSCCTAICRCIHKMWLPRRLASLKLIECNISGAVLGLWLEQMPDLKRLTVIDHRDSFASPHHLSPYESLRTLVQLHDLTIHGAMVSTRVARVIHQNRHRLRSIDLRPTRALERDECLALVSATAVTSLTVHNFGVLYGAPMWSQLRTLTLTCLYCGQVNTLLRQLICQDTLEHLSITLCEVSINSSMDVSLFGRFTRLKCLQLTNICWARTALVQLVSLRLPQLEVLDLSNCTFQDVHLLCALSRNRVPNLHTILLRRIVLNIYMPHNDTMSALASTINIDAMVNQLANFKLPTVAAVADTTVAAATVGQFDTLVRIDMQSLSPDKKLLCICRALYESRNIRVITSIDKRLQPMYHPLTGDDLMFFPRH